MAAVGNVNIYSPLSRLREDNWSLLSKLRQGQDDVLDAFTRMKSTSKAPYSPRTYGETTFTCRGADRTPVRVYRKIDRDLGRGNQASTPKNYEEALVANGNDRSRRTPTVRTSILMTPDSRRKKTPKKDLHVSFELSPRHDHDVLGDDHRRRSLLGYDWIAGLLDNTSFLSEKPDDFFEDLKEFRRVNKEECFGRGFNEQPYSPLKTTVSRGHQVDTALEEVTCENAYTLNDRLFPVPIHGPDTFCSVCKTKRESEYETEGSYVRVSVPRSSLLSPYKVKPHRRASFDPTDSVGLSSHCLAGWESSKPTVIPMPSSLDLRASLHHSRTTLDASRAGLFPGSTHDTQDLLNRSHSLRYGLQVLERERRVNLQPAHTTPYPIL